MKLMPLQALTDLIAWPTRQPKEKTDMTAAITEPMAVTEIIFGETVFRYPGSEVRYVMTMDRNRQPTFEPADQAPEEAPASDHNAVYLEAKDGTTYPLGLGPWTAALWLSWDHGWRPDGTRPGPDGSNLIVPETYLGFRGEQMSAADARRCASGLVKGIDRYERDRPRQSRGRGDTENPVLDLTCPALFPLEDARQAAAAAGGFYSLSVNLWGEVRSHMRDQHGAVDGTAWRELAAFLKSSAGVRIHGGKPKVTP